MRVPRARGSLVVMPDSYWAAVIFSVTPTILIGLVFWFVMRAIIRADRTERRVYAEIETEERAKLGLPSADGRVTGVSGS